MPPNYRVPATHTFVTVFEPRRFPTKPNDEYCRDMGWIIHHTKPINANSRNINKVEMLIEFGVLVRNK